MLHWAWCIWTASLRLFFCVPLSLKLPTLRLLRFKRLHWACFVKSLAEWKKSKPSSPWSTSCHLIMPLLPQTSLMKGIATSSMKRLLTSKESPLMYKPSKRIPLLFRTLKTKRLSVRDLIPKSRSRLSLSLKICTWPPYKKIRLGKISLHQALLRRCLCKG